MNLKEFLLVNNTIITFNRMSSSSIANIFVVDDDPINRKIVSKILAKLGFRNIYVAQNGLEMLNTVKKNNIKVSLIITDVQMPIMNGVESTQKIRLVEKFLNLKRIPIIGLSSIDRNSCLSAGMDDHIPKPLVVSKFVSILASFLPLVEP
ncbi:response regulator receiver domain-containing protein [Tieghemostelium lacteum]|uniref:Response regulator receiver domain-containing protein n=1 Tax=Tieghemostelium lacteum TaxID=361077 RepID=A0A151Z9U7_TIELA|nr:response regulator receiver domain-containing protein [Tieghemostelium lacteum]|eukprot:KYQ90728.1 response regulator receiver domain-containing protein [Tieghemostelium lacteum]